MGLKVHIAFLQTGTPAGTYIPSLLADEDEHLGKFHSPSPDLFILEGWPDGEIGALSR